MTSRAEYQRTWRANRRARTGQIGRPRRSTCGTPAGYKYHRYHQETACTLCKDAWAAQQRDMYRARRAARVNPSPATQPPAQQSPTETDT